MSARYHLGHGIVIRRQSLPSGDVVVTLLAEHGKWKGIARKGKLPGGNLGRLSLFHDVTVQFYRRREDDLALLTQIKLNGALPRLADPSVYPYAHILAELADALTVDVHIGEPLYEYLASGLRGLDRHPDPERVALLYAWRLLQQAGLAPRTRDCGGCGSDAPAEALDVAAGALMCGGCGGGGGGGGG
ncbi:MAG: DNA repair protein RecO, partial [Trueperaceae bacterium]